MAKPVAASSRWLALYLGRISRSWNFFQQLVDIYATPRYTQVLRSIVAPGKVAEIIEWPIQVQTMQMLTAAPRNFIQLYAVEISFHIILELVVKSIRRLARSEQIFMEVVGQISARNATTFPNVPEGSKC